MKFLSSAPGSPVDHGESQVGPPFIVSFRGSLISTLPNSQRQHRTLHIQKDVQPYAWCWLLCTVSDALASIFRMDSISTSYRLCLHLSQQPPSQEAVYELSIMHHAVRPKP